MLKRASEENSSLHYIPLRQVTIETTVRFLAADVKITLLFRHEEKQAIEGTFYLPFDDETVIYAFTIRIDDRQFVGQLQEKTSADNVLEIDDYLVVPLGLIPPSRDCSITIGYVTELDLLQGSIIRLVIPRWKSSDLSNVCRLEFNCDVEQLLANNGETLISQVTSPSHSMEIDDHHHVRLVQEETLLDRDILLNIHLIKERLNALVLMESNAAMAMVKPFDEDSFIHVDNEEILEYYFLLDCSSSMRNENKIDLCRQTMFYLLEHLPMNAYFNILLFGSICDFLFNQSAVIINRLHLQIAEKFIECIQADLGGSDLTVPLLWLKRHPPNAERLRHVFVLTDGEIPRVNEVFDLCRSIGLTTRIFSFGLGISPNRSLIKGLARLTNGRFVFLSPTTNDSQSIEDQLQKCLRRSISNIQVEWHLGVPVQHVPERIPSAYINDRLILYALVKGEKIPSNQRSSIAIRTEQSYYRLEIFDRNRSMNTNPIIGRLAAKALIRELIDRGRATKEVQQRLIDLSLKYHILTPYTRWIAVDRDQRQLSIGITRRRRSLPLVDERIVRYLIDQQNVDGLWDLNSVQSVVEKVIDKSLDVFLSDVNDVRTRMLVTAIVVVVLETNFVSIRSHWDPCADRARRRLIELLKTDFNRFVVLFHEIRAILKN